ncbi:MAG: hypothetical protein H6740_19425, partial [Alphaproteobacteria bacterium]|nr:hypothetical protein [Alphaproteobacteria bacterium]
DVYGLEGIERFFHGTLRHIGWCGTLQALLDLGYGGEAPRPELLGRPLSEVTLTLLGRRSGDARQAAAEALSRDPHDDALLRLDWLGLFSDRPARSSGGAATADIAAELMLERLGVFGPDSGVSSRVVNVFDLEARARGRVRRLRSTFDAHDEGVGHSTCSRLISETTALAGEALLCGPLRGLTGLHHPYQAEVYAPVLAGFEAMGFAPQLEERDGS